MNILSLYPLPSMFYAHDGAACLVKDGTIAFASEEERHLRSQHAIGHFPERAAILALKHGGAAPAGIDRLVLTSLERCWERPDYGARLQFTREMLLLPKSIPVSCVPHHLAHSALAVLTSPFDECVFLTLDGGGDGLMGQWGTFRNNRFEVHESLERSPAIFFSFVTSLCGFPLFEEGKAMGLASYGRVDETLLRWFGSAFRIARGGASLETALEMRWHTTLQPNRIHEDFFARHKYYQLTVDFTGPEDLRWIREIPPADIARTGQLFFQDLLAEAAANLVRRTGLGAVACSGGAFLNAVANGTLARQDAAAFFVPMAPHDAGLALGAALWTGHELGWRRPAYPVSPYLGPSFDERAVRDVLAATALDYDRPDDLIGRVAQAIAAGRVVGWFDGRAEHGARALGARSVLADPRNPDAKSRLNQLLKKRDWFMPFAPSILEEYGEEYFEDFRPSPYMSTAFKVRPSRIASIRAAVHVDGTCRAQSVSRALNPRYHALISRFHELTGIPLVLNTSFNQHGLPMVSTPRQAIQHLLDGCVDLLAIEGFEVRGAARPTEPETIDERTLLDLTTLRQGARLMQRGEWRSAQALVRRADLPIAVTDKGYVHDGALVWTADMPAERLDAWWCARAAAVTL